MLLCVIKCNLLPIIDFLSINIKFFELALDTGQSTIGTPMLVLQVFYQAIIAIHLSTLDTYPWFHSQVLADVAHHFRKDFSTWAC